ncbi:MAG: lipocalin-like domain-containing protein [Pseudomonadota bacterium]
MNVRRILGGAVAAALLLAPPAAAQGFAGLGTTVEGYAEVVPGRTFSFPEDHGPHPEFRIEWWYVTATLADADGRSFGLQWTLFRQAMTPDGRDEGWASNQIWMGHAAATSAESHAHAELFARGGTGQAGAVAAPFSAWIDGWEMTSEEEAFSPLRLRAQGADFAYDLRLVTDVLPVLQGDRGFSLKSDQGQASYYFSQPAFTAEGTLTIDGATHQVTGQAWMDREFSSQPLADDQDGWDWFALRLSDDVDLMLYRLRHAEGDNYFSGNWIENGVSTLLPRGAVRLEPERWTEVAGREVPTHWRVSVPDRDVALSVTPLNAQSWMDTSFPYWEGPVRFEGSHSGVGFLEMTGY